MLRMPKRGLPKTAGSRLAAGSALAAGCIALVAGFEGYRPTAYRDVVGVPTICFGETKGVRMGETRSRAACEALLHGSLVEHEAGMRRCLQRPDALPAPTYKAAVSFTYNLGVGNFCGSTFRVRLDAGDIRGACDELLKWNKAGGRAVAGLTRRRAEERTLCLQGLQGGSLPGGRLQDGLGPSGRARG